MQPMQPVSISVLTIAYMTNRREPRVDWFFASLARELSTAAAGELGNLRCVVVDFWADESGRRATFAALAPAGVELVHVPPKPTVWQGPHRLTGRDYFAAASARNTALCLAPDGWIAYVDDLSVLLPGWLAACRQGCQVHGVVCGAYKKVLFLEVEHGIAAHDYANHDLVDDENPLTWLCAEIYSRDLRDLGLRPYRPELFRFSAWAVLQKAATTEAAHA